MTDERIHENSAPPIGHAGVVRDDVAPDGSDIYFIVDAKHGATRAGLCKVRLGPGATTKPVQHRTVEEIWYVTRGERS
jgi:hypothetical protein